MINIVTIHHTDSKFIDLQSKYIKKFTKPDYKIFAGVYNCKNDYTTKYHWQTDLVGVGKDHHVRMNFLADKVLSEANDDEYIVFMDGDAFPFNDWVNKSKKLVDTYKLIAVQRNEIGDTFPHPIFLMTTVGFWRKNKLNWSFSYKNKRFPTSGPALECWLSDNDISWKPINKTNNILLHSFFFAIYDFIYHHGASFREPITSVDYKRANWKSGVRDNDYSNVVKFNRELSEFVLSKIKVDDKFIQYFLIGKND
jgi:hypothetical protein